MTPARHPKPEASSDSSDTEKKRRERLDKTWMDPMSGIGLLMCLDHRMMGHWTMLIAFTFLLLGGVLAALMRLQLTQPEGAVLAADAYNRFFIVHGTTMMFLFHADAISKASASTSFR